ncbi:MAG TPA: phage shock protein operon transcriptional activator [Candidatus Hydrogenedentes bacterium]|nr:phage shock protein operon transcriptional activator [Candidatus Hydrogenedentota bacterium]HPG69071.1 phage shock protein operon transcriptional activator [Candidatus Hydrogenedentota bacterium]
MATDSPPAREQPYEALGQSEAFLAFQERLSRAARIDRPVLILGERGTGKELAAYRLHFLSSRWQEPFVALNCAALAPGLIESELFGHEAGAFTGAAGRRTGRFEAAHGGTLFLDEIGAIPVEVQEKILRVVEYGTFERVGSSFPVRVDVRIVGATNADLVALAREGRFKQDLLDRLSFDVLFVPPLRARRDDIPLLAGHFAGRLALELGRDTPPEFSEVALSAIEAYAWPGNVRELKNVVERAVYMADGPVIHDLAFDPFRGPFSPLSAPPTQPEKHPLTLPDQASQPSVIDQVAALERPFKDILGDVEVVLLRRALERARFNQRTAAHLLGLTYDQFRGYYRKHRAVLAR